MEKYNFIHIFLNSSKIFNSATQALVNGLNLSYKHLFIYAYKQDINDINGNNIKFDDSVRSVEGLKKYFEIADYLIIHALNYSDKEIIKLTDSECNKIIWCVWGHDLYSIKTKHSLVYLITQKIYRLLRRRVYYNKLASGKISKFKGITVGFPGDMFTVREKYGNTINIYNALYPMGYNANDLEKWKEKVSVDTKYTKLRILLGHSAYEFLNHEIWIEKLKPYKNKIEIIIPLSYGNNKYALKVKEKAVSSIGGDKVYFLEKFMPAEEYFKFLCNIDIAIFDYEHQSAFGNILLLLYLQKRLYLSPNGIMYKGLKNIGATVYRTDELIEAEFKNLSHEELLKNRELAKNILDEETIKKQWTDMFKSCYGDI